MTASAFAGGLRIHTHEPLSQVLRQYRSRGWVSEAVSEPEGRAVLVALGYCYSPMSNDGRRTALRVPREKSRCTTCIRVQEM